MVDARRSPVIDLLRGLCVLLVVLSHIDLRFRLKQFDVSWLLPEPMRQVVFHSGYFAVITFFVISGFLITTLSIRRWNSPRSINIRQFYWMRFARIVPCLLALVLLLSLLHLFDVKEFVIKPERGTLPQAILAALTFHVNWLEGQQGYLPGSWDILWTLSVEEVFYLIFPLVCLLCRSERWLVIALLIPIIIGPVNRSMLVEQDPWGEYAYLSCADGLALGCLAAVLGARLRVQSGISRVLMILGISLAVLIVVFRGTAAAIGIPGRPLGPSILAIGIALILFSTSQGLRSARPFRGTKFIRDIGQSSYEIYLVHMLVVLGLIPFIVNLQPQASIPLWYGLMLALSVALGAAVRVTFSEPMNQFIRRRTIGGSEGHR